MEPWIDGQQCDKEAAEESTCPNCNHKGLRFEPRMVEEVEGAPLVYHAIAICDQCLGEFDF